MAYIRTGNIWKVAEELGMCGQSVHERLQRMGMMLSNRPITPAEEARIREVYEAGLLCGDGALEALAEELGRTKQLVCRTARKMGLTNIRRRITPELCEQISKRAKRRIAENGHPRGMLGKTHSPETKQVISEAATRYWEGLTAEEKHDFTTRQMETRIRKYGSLVTNRPHGSWKAGRRKVGDTNNYYRSRWEANYARYLEYLRGLGEIESWEHEPETFWFDKIKRGCRTYLPDFKVTEKGVTYYVEVKGWMDARSKTKLKRMAKYHPKVDLRLVDTKAYKALARQVPNIVPGWESD